ncbi:hypothetical protein QBC38DRAFT_446977 [Podospora fimiseda]|uniref:Uncharacterized protein n=1 Tax=Podospora fimiseda TaxID=252190 RepID=A0AAN7GPK0_9PEZI|nr:hypothetical protein QBC38DRAFT_446977 [Podospora fimiseda]
MRPEYLPPLVIPLRKSSSTVKIHQVQKEQLVPCPVYRPKAIHPQAPVPSHPLLAPPVVKPEMPPPSVPSLPPPAPPVVKSEIYELPGDFHFPSTEKPPDSALEMGETSSTSSKFPNIPFTESPIPLVNNNNNTILDKETINTLQAYYRHSIQQTPPPQSPSSKTKLHRSSAIYVRNPHALVSSPTNRRKTIFHTKQEQQQDILELKETTRTDTYSSVLSDWEQEAIDHRIDIRDQYQPSEALVTEFGERQQEALKELMGFLDEVLGITSSKLDEGTSKIGSEMAEIRITGNSSPVWWMDVRKSLL